MRTVGWTKGSRVDPEPSEHEARHREAGRCVEHAAARVDAAADGESRTSLFIGVDALCDTAVRLSGVDGAAVAVLTASTRVRELVFATNAVAQQIDELQFVLGEGPCLDAYRFDRPELCAQLDTGSMAARWPAFVTETVALDVRAVFAIPIPGAQRPIGVLELYRSRSGDLGADELQSATTCAGVVGATMTANWNRHVTLAGSTAAALDAAAVAGAGLDESDDPFDRSQVYMAAGMVAVQLAVSPEAGLDRLRAYAYGAGRAITAVAADIAERRLSLRHLRDDQGTDI